MMCWKYANLPLSSHTEVRLNSLVSLDFRIDVDATDVDRKQINHYTTLATQHIEDNLY